MNLTAETVVVVGVELSGRMPLPVKRAECHVSSVYLDTVTASCRMNCDIKTVIAILYKQLVSSSVNTYQALVDMLFKSYFDDPTSPEYDRSEPSKLNAGTRTLSSKITD